jgi:predicted permease
MFVEAEKEISMLIFWVVTPCGLVDKSVDTLRTISGYTRNEIRSLMIFGMPVSNF